MDDTPQTRKEKKGTKKGPRDSVYSSRRVRQLEAMIEKNGIKPSSSASKTQPKTETSSSTSKPPKK